MAKVQVKIPTKTNRKQGISPLGAGGMQNQEVGFGRIYIPKDVDRDKYVDTCYRTGRVDIYDENYGQTLRQCLVTNEVLQNLRFPRMHNQIGDAIVWVRQPDFMNVPIVVGTIPIAGRPSLRADEELIIHKEWDDGALNIDGNARNGTLYITVRGQKFSDIQISALGNKKSLLKLRSSGMVYAEADKVLKGRSFGLLDVQLVNPDTSDNTGVKVDKNKLEFSANYSVDEEDKEKKNYTKATITKDGMQAEQFFCEDEDTTKYNLESTKEHIKTTAAIQGEDVILTEEVNKEEAMVQFKDCLASFKEKCALLQQGEDPASVVVELKDGKSTLKNGTTTLNQLIEKLVSTIETLTVTTPMGPSGTPLPPTIMQLTEIKTLLKGFFNE